MFFNLNKNVANNKYSNKTVYSVNDALSMFFLVLIWGAVFAGFIFTILFSIIAGVMGVTLQEFMDFNAVKMFLMLATHIVFFAVFFYYNKRRNIAVVKATKLKRELSLRNVVIVVALSLITLFMFAPLVNLLDYLYSLFGYNPTAELPFALTNVPEYLFALFAVAVLPALSEEIIFRGQVLGGLLQKLKPFAAIALSALLFTLMHGALQQTAYQMLLGIVLGMVFVATKNLWYTIIFHFINNAIVVTSAFVVNLSGEATETVVQFSTVTDFVVPVVVFFVGVFAVLFLVSMLTKTPIKKFTDIFNLSKILKNDFSTENSNIIEINEARLGGGVVTTQVVMEQEQQKEGIKSFTQQEMLWLTVGLLASAVLWISNTLSAIKLI